ncbi:helix-turn-helix domain-containing protein [Kibdelosporangium lantanae]|uniref:Helix-turn-helix domain-containing protein n=1 Tax=Kibdelosporangium lantanae TaxID=1497396 RepID=A0ABW3MAV7_9PSEU
MSVDASGPPYINTPWCQALRRAASSMTREELAGHAGYSKAKIQQVLGGHQEPTIDELVRIGDALRVPRLRLLAIAGYIDGLADLLTHLDQLERQDIELTRAARAMPLEPPSATAWIVDKIIADGTFTVAVRPRWEGVAAGRRLHYADVVSLELVTGEPNSVATKDYVESILERELAWFGASVQSARHAGDSDHRPLSIYIPRMFANRQCAEPPLPGLPRSVAVVGGHWCGSADVASLLGHAFNYDYSHVSFVASRIFTHLTHRWEEPHRKRDRLEVVRTYVTASDISRERVWAADVGDDDAAPTAALIAAAVKSKRTMFVINLRPTDELIEWAADMRQELEHTNRSKDEDVDVMRTTRSRVDEILQQAGHRTLTLTASLPPARQDPDPGVPPAFLDLWADLAEQAVTELRRKHNFHFDEREAIQRLRAVFQVTDRLTSEREPRSPTAPTPSSTPAKPT